MAILAQALLALVGGHLMSLAFFSTRHNENILVIDLVL